MSAEQHNRHAAEPQGVRNLSSVDNPALFDGNSQCSICLEALDNSVGGVKAAQLIDCQHIFHQGCLVSWNYSQNAGRDDCPNCRRPFRIPYAILAHHDLSSLSSNNLPIDPASEDLPRSTMYDNGRHHFRGSNTPLHYPRGYSHHPAFRYDAATEVYTYVRLDGWRSPARRTNRPQVSFSSARAPVDRSTSTRSFSTRSIHTTVNAHEGRPGLFHGIRDALASAALPFRRQHGPSRTFSEDRRRRHTPYEAARSNVTILNDSDELVQLIREQVRNVVRDLELRRYSG